MSARSAAVTFASHSYFQRFVPPPINLFSTRLRTFSLIGRYHHAKRWYDSARSRLLILRLFTGLHGKQSRRERVRDGADRLQRVVRRYGKLHNAR